MYFYDELRISTGLHNKMIGPGLTVLNNLESLQALVWCIFNAVDLEKKILKIRPCFHCFVVFSLLKRDSSFM